MQRICSPSRTSILVVCLVGLCACGDGSDSDGTSGQDVGAAADTALDAAAPDPGAADVPSSPGEDTRPGDPGEQDAVTDPGDTTPADPGDQDATTGPEDTTPADPGEQDATTDPKDAEPADPGEQDTPADTTEDAAADTAEPPVGPPNLVLVVLDDFGVDALAAYRDLESLPEAPTPATPAIDALMADGVLFRRAWASPTCSPTRMALHASLYAAQTGVIAPVGQNEEGLKQRHETLPERLGDGWRKGLFGKWHLAGNRRAPVHVGGWDVYSGKPHGGLDDFSSWKRTYVEKGAEPIDEIVETYATTVNVDDALRWLREGDQDKPYMLMLAFNAPHTPYHLPPAALRPTLPDEALDADGDGECDSAAPCFRAMVEAADTEIGRLVAALPEIDGGRDTVVVVMGDNGTHGEVIETPYSKRHAKGSLYDGGVHVPIVISGPERLVPARGSSDLFVHAVDLPVTLLALAGVEPLAAAEGRDLMADLRGEGGDPRTLLYADGASGPPDTPVEGATARGRRYKVLIPDVGALDDYSCFDLTEDPNEEEDLRTGPEAPAAACQRLHEALLAERARLTSGSN